MDDNKSLTVYGKTALDPEVSLKRKEVATGLFKSGLFPNVRNEFGAFAVVQYGAELGMAPMVSLQNINVISGKLVTNGQVMLALAQSRGVEFEVLEETDKICTILFKKGRIQYKATFSVTDAQAAKLTEKDNWKKYIKDMLFWRAVAKGVRRIDPAAVMGLYTPDEITDGEIVDVSEIKYSPAKETEILSMHDQAIQDMKDIADLTHLGNYWKKHYREFKGDPRFAEIEQFKDQIKREIIELKQSEESSVSDAHEMVKCPNSEEMVFTDFCNGGSCEHRQGCPAY